MLLGTPAQTLVLRLKAATIRSVLAGIQECQNGSVKWPLATHYRCCFAWK